MKQLEQRPFALIGVNSIEHTPEELGAVMERENLPWRSFADQGAIVKRWNLSATPTYYVLDHRGVIRFKWAGNPAVNALEAALEPLIREAEQDARAGGAEPAPR